jgi:hypothetical protein
MFDDPPGPGDVRHLSCAQLREGATRPVRAVARLAAGQHGVVATRRLTAIGLDSSTITRWTADGRLIRLHRGVYAVGHGALMSDGHRMAAVLAAGVGAVLSHRSAAVLDVAEAAPSGVPRAVEEADRQSRLDLAAVRAVMARNPGRRGLRPLASALEVHTPEPAVTRSGLERAALALIRDHGLPRPGANLWLHGYEVDLLRSDQKLVVELDTLRFHGTSAAVERDRRRDADLQARGYHVMRFTDRRIAGDPAGVAATIAAALARATAAGAAR